MTPRTCRSISRLFASAFLVGPLTLKPLGAASQELNPPDQVPNTGQDFFKPPQNLFQLLYGYKTAPGSGETEGSITTVTTDTVDLRLDHRIDLSPQAVIALRSDLPLLAKNPSVPAIPTGIIFTALAAPTRRPSSFIASTRSGRPVLVLA
jgi:hypothetical protein